MRRLQLDGLPVDRQPPRPSDRLQPLAERFPALFDAAPPEVLEFVGQGVEVQPAGEVWPEMLQLRADHPPRLVLGLALRSRCSSASRPRSSWKSSSSRRSLTSGVDMTAPIFRSPTASRADTMPAHARCMDDSDRPGTSASDYLRSAYVSGHPGCTPARRPPTGGPRAASTISAGASTPAAASRLSHQAASAGGASSAGRVDSQVSVMASDAKAPITSALAARTLRAAAPAERRAPDDQSASVNLQGQAGGTRSSRRVMPPIRPPRRRSLRPLLQSEYSGNSRIGLGWLDLVSVVRFPGIVGILRLQN